MKILHINTNDRGGAATAIIRIHQGLLKKGVDSKILFLNKRKDLPETYAFTSSVSKWRRGIEKLKGFLKTSDKKLRSAYPMIEWFSDPTSRFDITEHPLYKEADIIQLNWVSGFLDEPSFFSKNTKPVVWRMPDLYTCGGGYHYEKGFPFKELEKRLAKNKRIRKKALQGANITFVPISRWVAEKASESTIISSFPRQTIHNGLDFTTWKPQDRNLSREAFGIPKEKTVLLLGADIAHVERKGFDRAVQAIQQLNDPSISTVVFGNYQEALPEGFLKVGRIASEAELTKLYSASNYFIMPSLEEAFGQVTLEALSCGVPVVSFPSGGSVDMVRPGFNGILASEFSEEALLKALKKGLSTDFDSEAIVVDIQQRFSLEEKVNVYHELYQQLLL